MKLTPQQIRAMGPEGELSLYDKMPTWQRVLVIGALTAAGVAAFALFVHIIIRSLG